MFWLNKDNVTRVDAIFDVWIDKERQYPSLKSSTWKKRAEGVASSGVGPRLVVNGNTKCPRSTKAFSEFFTNNDNKNELAIFIADELRKALIPEGKLLVVTKG